MSVKMEVWGEYACFSRPELKTEKFSYHCITPSAARGLLEAVFWHPGLKWIVDKIYILSPIEFTNIRRNEVKSKLSHTKAKSALTGKNVDLYIDTTADIQQRAAAILKNVHYVIEAHFEMTENASKSDNPGKFQDMMRRRLEKGQCYHQPYLGCREFPAKFRRWEFDTVPTVDITKDLGLMLYDLDYSDKNSISPMFFNARIEKGVLDLKDCEVYR
ncbi:MAG: type I-C CRISPR-associated protein Cas5c [Ruminococcus sp.]|nr:type I-C CRISPR-associated protein Cas5c [Ruminococcus sp.]